MRALLVPERELAGELRVLVDARLDLLRAIDEARLGKVEDHSGAVMRAVAARGDPADQVVAVEGREGKNLNKLEAARIARSRLSGQGHEDEVRVHLLRGLISLVRTGFRGHGPLVFPVKENLGVGHMVEAVDIGLQAEQQFGITNVRAQPRGHG